MHRYRKPSPSSLSNLFTEQEQSMPSLSPSRISFQAPPPPPSYDHHHDNLLYSPGRSSTTNCLDPNFSSLLPPPSPDSPWILSPHQTPSPSLLYHCISTLHRHDGAVLSIAAARGIVFTGSESSMIHAWRQTDCTEKGYFRSGSGEVRAILAHGHTIFTSHKDLKVRIWKITSSPGKFQAKKLTTLPKPRSIFHLFSPPSACKPKSCISCMAYNHADGLLYTGSWDKTVRVWRVSDPGCVVDSFTAHEDQINDLLINQIDGSLFTCSSDGSVKIWRRVYGQNSHTLTLTLRLQQSPVNALALSSSSSTTSCFLYSASSDGFINFWEKEKISGRFNHGGFLQGHRFAVLCLAAIEKLIFSGSEDTTIRVWRREEGSFFHECLAVIDAHRGPVKCLAATLEIEKVLVMGFLVYSAGLDQAFKVWRIKVLPEEKEDVGMEAEYVNPVLSPSWVEKKIQWDKNPFH